MLHTHETWSLPKQFNSHAQQTNIEQICFFGIVSIEGERILLSDRAQRLLRFIGLVKRRDFEYRGGPDPADLERPEALGRWGDKRTWQRAYAELLELDLVRVERWGHSERGRILKVWLLGEVMEVPRPRKAIKVGWYEPESYPQAIHTRDESTPGATKVSQQLSRWADPSDNPLPLCGRAVPAAALGPPSPPATDEQETPRTAGPNGSPPARIATAASVTLIERTPALVGAAVALTNGNTRQRQQGATDHSGAAAPLPAWWRSLIRALGLAGRDPPS